MKIHSLLLIAFCVFSLLPRSSFAISSLEKNYVKMLDSHIQKLSPYIKGEAKLRSDSDDRYESTLMSFKDKIEKLKKKEKGGGQALEEKLEAYTAAYAQAKKATAGLTEENDLNGLTDEEILMARKAQFFFDRNEKFLSADVIADPSKPGNTVNPAFINELREWTRKKNQLEKVIAKIKPLLNDSAKRPILHERSSKAEKLGMNYESVYKPKIETFKKEIPAVLDRQITVFKSMAPSDPTRFSVKRGIQSLMSSYKALNGPRVQEYQPKVNSVLSSI